MDEREWQAAHAEARAKERRERETRYLLTMAAMRHRETGILRFENRDLIGGVPVSELHFTVEVDALTFWNALDELKRRKGWR